MSGGSIGNYIFAQRMYIFRVEERKVKIEKLVHDRSLLSQELKKNDVRMNPKDRTRKNFFQGLIRGLLIILLSA
jgi:hypothetical protein